MALDEYCGHPFWDETIWNSSAPILSPCFSETGLLWTSSAFLWILTPFSIYLTGKTPKPSLIWTWRLYMRLFLCLILCGSTIYEVINAFLKYNRNVILIYPYEYTSPIIRLFSFLIATCLMLLHKQKGAHTSGLLFVYWLFMVIQSSINYWTVIDSIQYPAYRDWTFETADLILKSIQWTSITLICLFHFVADTINHDAKKKINTSGAFATSSFLSQLLFLWYDSMAYIGFKKSLVESDLWDLPEESCTQTIQDKFSLLLAKSRAKLKTKTAKKISKPKSNLFSTLLKGFWPMLTVCLLLKLVSCLLTFVSPQLLDAILTFISSNDPTWKGIILAIGIFVAALLQSLFNSQHEFWIQTTSMRMRAALISAIYHKSLRLSGLGRRDYTSGEIVNLMAVDTQRIIDYINTINVLWAAPVQIALSVTLLWAQLGVASIAGLILILALVPLNAVIRTAIKNYQIKVMKEKDKRARMMSEVLNGMKVLKLYAWEGAFEDMIMSIRQNEIRHLKKQAIWTAVTNFIANFAPFGVSLVCFATFILSDSSNVLNANKAFVSMSLINLLREPLMQLPMVVTYGANCVISIKRINKYLQGDELDPNSVSHEPNIATPIQVKNASFSWSEEEEEVLKDINMDVPRNKLIAIVGTVGSGKSSLLAALLGDLQKKQGFVNVSGRVAYVPQSAWLQNATVCQNIVFGEVFRQEKYKHVIDACALTPDMEVLPGGDKTEIGERGINLSGGQKQRISIARAVYANADVYLLDDPLSAVDAHVAAHLFDKVIGPNSLLKHKTRLLVTHRITFLPQVDEIIVMKDGKIHENGTYSELMARKGEFADFIVQYLADSEADEVLQDEDPVMIEAMKASVKPELEMKLSLSRKVSIGAFSRQGSRISINSTSSKDKTIDARKGKDNDYNIVTIEKAETGSVKLKVYLEFFRAIGIMAFVVTMLFYVGSNALSFGSNLWLTEWSEDYNDPSKVNDSSFSLYRLGVYAVLGTTSSIMILINATIIAMAFLNGATWIHNQMLTKIIRAPMSFFDTTPMGRILNRFTADIANADTTICLNFRAFFIQGFRGLVSIIGICTETGYLALGIGIIGIFYILIQKFYIASSRQLRRIESITRSPIYSHFSETISGSTSIRAYGASAHFIQECHRKVDVNHSSLFLNIGANRWLSIRLEFFGNLIVTIAAFTAVASRGSSTAGATGLALSYALQITAILNNLIRSVSNIENNIVSIERCLEFTRVESEALWIDYHNRPRETWPEEGKIVLKNYSTRYREGLDLVLKNIFCTIKPNEKVGIVGRTGAGKSSLTLALFRLIEPVQGTIGIDGEDISKFGLHDLRSRLTIIPQDPVLFSATFRNNFDPFQKYSDAEIWKALEQANLKDYVASLDSGLNYQIAEGGENLSVGQRQLVCLTRALLRKTKVLVLDEATAAVDIETDELIQQTIRHEFSDCTIVTIAHRLNTIMDYDKIMVMDKGKIVEYDSPVNLIANTNSIFYSMAKEAKLV